MKLILPENTLKNAKSERIAVRLKNKGAQAVRKGHPWVFEDSIERVSKSASSGAVAVLFDSSSKNLLGAGLYDPDSTVRVKVLAHGAKMPPVGRLLFQRNLEEALALRLPALPPETNAWRVVHGESDGFSGLVADKYDDTLVLKLYSTAWCPWLDEVMECFMERLPEIRRCVVRLSREVKGILKGSTWFDDGSVFYAEKEPPFDGNLVFMEHGIRFGADVIRGQKTGFFLDQRDNRFRVSRLSRGKRVLNVFSYSGGFSLYAAAGGAVEVVSEDINRHAIESVDANFERNRGIPAVAACRHSEITDDAFAAMERLFREKQKFDIVIVDPPSFAKAEAEVKTALNTYARLARAAVKLLVPKGLLVFASCSSRVTAERLFEVVNEAARSVGRPLKEIERTAHAVDHPAKFKESSYLKCLFAEAGNGRA